MCPTTSQTKAGIKPYRKYVHRFLAMFKLVILANVVKVHGMKNDRFNQIIQTNINFQLRYTLITAQNDFRVSVCTILSYS